MKKQSLKFLIVAVFIACLYIATAIFTLGSVFTPSKIYAWKTDGNPNNTVGQNSYTNVDLSDNQNHIANIYVFIGEVKTHSTDKDGNEFITVNFDFKTKSDFSGSSQYYNKSVSATIPVVYGSGGYKFIKVYDSKDIDEKTQKEKGEIPYQRVKINTPHCLDFHEVVFTDKDGKVLRTEINSTDENERTRAKLLVDEQEYFTTSTSKKFILTDKEIETLYMIRGLKNGEKTAVTSGPLSVAISWLGVSIFGENTFGVRFFNLVSGLAVLTVVFYFTVKLFGERKYGVTASVFALTIGAVFSASTFGFELIGALFALLAIYMLAIYFIKYYYGEGGVKGLLTLILSGVFYGLSIASNMAYSVIIVGLVGLFVFAHLRAKKLYKKQEKEAKGLEKEEIFLSFRKKTYTSVLTAICSFVIIPIIIFILAFILVGRVYKSYYGVGLIASAVKYTAFALTPAYAVNPFALLVGFGGQNFKGYYSFLNYFATVLGLLSFVFVTVATVFGKKIAFLKNMPSVTNKYKIITCSFVAFLLTVFLGYNSSVVGFVGVSVFYAVYIAFAEYILAKSVSGKVTSIVIDSLAVISLVIFAMAYCGYVGISLPQIAKDILYTWQVL